MFHVTVCCGDWFSSCLGFLTSVTRSSDSCYLYDCSYCYKFPYLLLIITRYFYYDVVCFCLSLVFPCVPASLGHVYVSCLVSKFPFVTLCFSLLYLYICYYSLVSLVFHFCSFFFRSRVVYLANFFLSLIVFFIWIYSQVFSKLECAVHFDSIFLPVK